MDEREVLVSLRHADGTAGVWRDPDGSVWLTGLLERGGGTGLDQGEPRVEGLSADRMVQGGMLPTGAVAAEVVDDGQRRHAAVTAAGAWVVVLDQPAGRGLVPVRFLDEDGQTVRPSLPPDWPAEPVADATESCPACGAQQWDEVRALDLDSRGAYEGPTGRMEPARIVVCRVCGHEQAVPLFFGPMQDAGWEDVDEGERLPARLNPAVALRRVRFPVYAVSGRTPRVTSWGSTGRDRVTDIALEHGSPEAGQWIEVSTEGGDFQFDGEATVARHALELRLRDVGDSWPVLSEAALALWHAAEERELRRVVATAAATPVEFAVDRQTVEFQLVRVGTRWAAASRFDDVRVTITARDVETADVALERVPDPSALANDW